ncbi:sulfite oxidase heme-binding subunit YedZ [Azonexus sp.]|uniref:sulfite oxidase heme-binding subunit YedZ n=1 Tax=Azonexus sp. TaxID=1872668 RepID=UPI0039E68499
MKTAATPPLALAKCLVFCLSLLPACLLWWDFEHNLLGSEPIEAVQGNSGRWALHFLLLALCISPLRALTQLHWLQRLRRMLGLFAFFYACLHLLAFAGLNNDFSILSMLQDIRREPMILAGLLAFVLLIPLAATSSNYAVHRLGGRRWQELQRNIYPISILACLHFLGQTAVADWPLPLAYSVFLGLLLWWRIQERRRKAQAESAIATPAATTKPIQFYRQRPK